MVLLGEERLPAWGGARKRWIIAACALGLVLGVALGAGIGFSVARAQAVSGDVIWGRANADGVGGIAARAALLGGAHPRRGPSQGHSQPRV
jgi:hypothetical protein